MGNIRWDDTVYVDEIPEKLEMYRINNGDILIGLDRPWISNGIRVTIFDGDEETYLVQRVMRIRETSAIIKDYIVLMLRSNLFRNSVEGETTGISVPHISPNQVCNVAIPLPPLAEQKRIVEKLETILPLCERFKIRKMYRLIYLIGFLIRQFVLPNPFSPFGDSAFLINTIVGGVFVPISYIMTGLVYDSGSAPVLGSIVFNVVYAINTGVTYLVCLAYPRVWLMVVIAVAYLVLFGFGAYKVREAQ